MTMTTTPIDDHNDGSSSSSPTLSYEDQLRSLFQSCDAAGRGQLDRPGLQLLCSKLNLEPEQTDQVLAKVLLTPDDLIVYDNFKQAFVDFLEEISQHKTHQKQPQEVDVEEVDANGVSQLWPSRPISKAEARGVSGYISKVWSSTFNGHSSDGINRHQFRHLCSVIQPNPLTDELVDHLFSSLDPEESGQIFLEDFLTLFKDNLELFRPSAVSGAAKPFGSMEATAAAASQRAGHIDWSERFCKEGNIVQYWHSIGLHHCNDLLEDLGLIDPHLVERLDAKEWCKWLFSELDQCVDSIGVQVANGDKWRAKGKAAVLICKAELTSLRSHVDSVEQQRMKLMQDLADTNQRVAAFAQEVDDQNARLEEANAKKMRDLEKHYMLQLKQLQGELSQEKEQHASLSQEIDSKKRYYSLQLSEQESRLKQDLSQLQLENQRLEEENDELKARLRDSEALNRELKLELDRVANLSGELNGWSPVSPLSQSKVHPDWESDIIDLNNRIKQLTDQNDELRTQLLIQSHGQVEEGNLALELQHLQPDLQESFCDDHDQLVLSLDSHLTDEKRELREKLRQTSELNANLVEQVQELESEMRSIQTRLSETSEQLDEYRFQRHADEKRIDALSSQCFRLKDRLINGGKLLPEGVAKDLQPQPKSLPACIDQKLGSASAAPCDLEQHCQNLETELEVVKKEILKILWEKNKCCKENVALKNAMAANSLDSEDSNVDSSMGGKTFHDRSSPDGQEEDLRSSVSPSLKRQDVAKADEEHLKQMQDKVEQLQANLDAERESATQMQAKCHSLEQQLQEQHLAHERLVEQLMADHKGQLADLEAKYCDLMKSKESETEQIRSLEEKCRNFEESLDLMAKEFDKMEDYWQTKLDEERRFFDDQVSNSDLKFRELEGKIREYEEILLNSDDLSKSCKEDDKLSTIEETASLESQVLHLEDELAELRDALRSKDAQISDLERQHSQQLSKQVCLHTAETQRLNATIERMRMEVCKAKMVCQDQAVLMDIGREKDHLVHQLIHQLPEDPSSGQSLALNVLRGRLRHQEERCVYLQAALRRHQQHSVRILDDLREQHEAEVRNLENLRKVSEEMLQQQLSKYSDQMEKLAQSQTLVNQLLSQNQNLVFDIRQLNESQQFI